MLMVFELHKNCSVVCGLTQSVLHVDASVITKLLQLLHEFFISRLEFRWPFIGWKTFLCGRLNQLTMWLQPYRGFSCLLGDEADVQMMSSTELLCGADIFGDGGMFDP